MVHHSCGADNLFLELLEQHSQLDIQIILEKHQLPEVHHVQKFAMNVEIGCHNIFQNLDYNMNSLRRHKIQCNFNFQMLASYSQAIFPQNH